MEGTTATPTDTGAATTGPTTFTDPGLSWTDAPSASTPSPESTPAESASADATVQPAVNASTDGSTPGTGEPPKERWDTILANARQKAADDAIAPLAWAKQVDQQEFQQIQQLARHFSQGDPVAGLQGLLAEIRKDPQHDAAIRSWAAKTLAQRQQQPAQEQAPQTVNVQLEDGSVVQMPRDPAAWLAFHQKQWMQSVQQEIQPLRQTHEQLQSERAAVAKQQEIDSYVGSTFQDVTTWPGMADLANQKAVALELTKTKIGSDDPREVTLALNAAYRKVVLPTFGQRAEAKLLDTLQHKATASTSVNPGSSAPSAPRAVRSFADLPADAWK